MEVSSSFHQRGAKRVFGEWLCFSLWWNKKVLLIQWTKLAGGSMHLQSIQIERCCSSGSLESKCQNLEFEVRKEMVWHELKLCIIFIAVVEAMCIYDCFQWGCVNWKRKGASIEPQVTPVISLCDSDTLPLHENICLWERSEATIVLYLWCPRHRGLTVESGGLECQRSKTGLVQSGQSFSNGLHTVVVVK